MLKNYFKIAWRNLIRNKGFSMLNILGLSIGLTVTALIFLWINFEISVEQFHENKDRIYEVNNQYPVDGEIWTWNSTPKIMAATIENDYPEIEMAVRYGWGIPYLFAKDDQRIKATGNIVDDDFLQMFSFPLLQGDKESVFEDAYSVVLTKTLATKLFGDENPMGQAVKVNNSEVFTVKGVLEDLPQNTEFEFEYLLPWAYSTLKGWDDENWNNNSITTYVMLKEGVNPNFFSEKIKTLRAAHDKASPDMVTYLYPFTRTYLYAEFKDGVEAGGRIDLVRMFGIIALIILIVACINFMNMSTAKSERRAREVGMRKVIGAHKNSLILQFLGESILIAFISGVLALAFVLLILPAFNILVERPLAIDLSNTWFWIISIGVVLCTGILAGSYPAFYLSAFRPASVLKGTFQKVNTLVTPRKVLVIAQFTFAVALISATLIVRQQIQKVQNRQLGYSKDQLVYSPFEGDMGKHYSLIKDALISSGTAISVTKTNSPITETWSNSWDFEWAGKDENDKTLVHRLIADEEISTTMGLELVLGRDFDLKNHPTDSTAAILNESAVAHMGFADPIGQTVRDNGIDWRIIGVVKDFVFNSPLHNVNPMMIEGAKADWFDIMHVKLNPSNSMAENLSKLESIFKKYNPEYPFTYEFVDEDYAKRFSDQEQVGKIAGLFTLLTILISCLGLFGLASYMAEKRTKEIGVRKVLGASVANITKLISNEFLKLVVVSFFVGIPLSWYFMNRWLSDFTFRINITWWVFAMAAGLILIIALLTVSFQAIKAATQNPTESLRTE